MSQTFRTGRDQRFITADRLQPSGLGKALAVAGLTLLAATQAQAAITCERNVTANVVAFDKPLMYNRLGAGNVNGMMFALKRDVVDASGKPLTVSGAKLTAGQLDLRPDKRHRPLVLRVRRGDCLTVNLTNRLTMAPNPRQIPPNVTTRAGQVFDVQIDEQIQDRAVSFHASGMQLIGDMGDDGSYVGNNLTDGFAVAAGGTKSYKLYAEREGAFNVTGSATFGSDGNQGNTSNGLFGQLIVEPTGAKIYRSQVHEEEMRLAKTGITALGQPIINYEASYPTTGVWASEGKAGLPVLNMMKCSNATTCEIVHSEINAVIAGPNANGSFPPSTYPLESVGKRNPTVPTRLEPFREFASVFHDETANGQAFPGFYVDDPVFKYVLAGVKDAFMINYGSGGIGSEIIANRLGVGPMHDCLTCNYEEFFLTSFAVGDPALTVDVPANLGLEHLAPGASPAGHQGPKANYVIGADDPSNVHHSYIGDFAKFRNTHIGKEQHVFHLHNHQWLYNPNDDNSNYLDAQGVGPGVGYTYEINFGGSGNRNKSTGDAIFHCHFYPHFAQGMWYHWRHHDVFEAGTILAGTPSITRDVDGFATATGYHKAPWGLAKAGGKPAPGSRAYPDGEIRAGTPIPAVVPLPGKPMPVMPGRVTTVENPLKVAPAINALVPPVGSLAKVIDRNLNPGYPFWIAGIEDIVGQRPPSPVLDMIDKAQATALKATGNPLWQELTPDQADGWDGGLPRHALQGYAAGGADEPGGVIVSRLDFSKRMGKAAMVPYPEDGTVVEKVAMAFHALRCHDSYLPNGTAATCTGGAAKQFLPMDAPLVAGWVSTPASTATGGFITNGGGGPVVGAPFHNSCIDDRGIVLKPNMVGSFFSGDVTTTDFNSSTNPSGTGLLTKGSSIFNSDTPRIYKGAFMQFDAVFNKVGYHYPQQRIVGLWQDVAPVIQKTKPPEPLVFRMNTFDCAVYHNTNLVPQYYELDDYQVRTPTDIIGQHIHLPKWDLTTADGAANGWNYEDGPMSPGMIQERIAAINCFNGWPEACNLGVAPPTVVEAPRKPLLTAKDHPYFGKVAANLGGGFPAAWKGARTITERWFTDPVVNTEGVDRGLGIIFTHDHYGPSSHQQIGLYATLLAEPAGSRWKHNETGAQLGYDPVTGAAARTDTTSAGLSFSDGGPTSWQAAILPPAAATGGSTVKAETLKPFREFYLEFSDFQHAYEAGVYVGADQEGLPLSGTGPGLGAQVLNTGNPQFTALGNRPEEAFRFAINPPAREQIAPVFPDLVLELANTPAGLNNFCPQRPCPGAISVQDPGMLVVNYRNEPVGLRVFDPNKPGPDTKNGMQADGDRGDLAFALQSRTDRAIAQMNVQPAAWNTPSGTTINGTKFPPPINAGGVQNGDPFTPMLRTYAGDRIHVKIQAGGHEEEHNATIHGLKWLQAGSGHGTAPNSGWRNAQAAGISEQFTLNTPVMADMSSAKGSSDYAWSVDAGNDGWWSGMWGLVRNYNQPKQRDLYDLPGMGPLKPGNLQAFALQTTPVDERAQQGGTLNGVCPTTAPRRNYDVSVVLANQVLPKPAGTTLPVLPDNVAKMHVGAALDPLGGTLVYNHRDAVVSGSTIDDLTGLPTTSTFQGPLHDPTAIMYVRTSDLDVNGKLPPGAPLEPVVLRAAAGDCINVTLRNKLPLLVPDLATYSTLIGVVKRDRLGTQGATTFNNNLIRPSSHVGMHPQLVEYDVTRNDGANVGRNPVQTVAPGATRTYQWYAGDLGIGAVSGALADIVATPVEFGGVNLMPADKIKQGAKSLVGAMVIEPVGSTWTELTTVFDHQTGSSTTPRATRAQATVTAGASTFRDFSLVLTKGNTHYYKDGKPVQHMNGEGVGIPEDSQEASGMLLNYGIEPMWFRFGILPQAPFGPAATTGSYASIPNSHKAYHNSLPVPGVLAATMGDPVTPVFIATAGMPARVRITNPYGTTRGSTFQMHGHLWQRDPYVCPGETRNLLTGACLMTSVASRAIGQNPQGFYEAGRDSWTPASHFDIVMPSAGGANAVKGDYLYRDAASFGSASGVWGIMRVQ